MTVSIIFKRLFEIKNYFAIILIKSDLHSKPLWKDCAIETVILLHNTAYSYVVILHHLHDFFQASMCSPRHR